MNKVVSINNLEDCTKQEVYDYIANHLLTQNKKCLKEKQCLYHHNELRCAAGCLIPEDKYDPDIEETNWDGLTSWGFAPSNHRYLIEDLQIIHDSEEPKDWREKIIEVDKKHKLNYDNYLS